MRKLVFLIIAAALISAPSVRAEDWPQWGGPGRDNVSSKTGWAESWPDDGPPVLWQAEVGVGDGEVSVACGKVYSLGLFAPDAQTTVPRGKEQKVSEVLLCLDARTGREKWRRIVATGQVQRGRAWQHQHGVPTVRQGRVYARSCWGHTTCYRAEDGEVVWSRGPESFGAAALDHGYQDSPLLVDGMLLFVVQVTEQRKVQLIAISAEDGQDLWRADLSAGRLAHWSPPAHAVIGGESTVVALCNEFLFGLDPADGRERWRFDAMKAIGRTDRAGSFGHTYGDANPPRVCGDIVVAEARHFVKTKMRCTSDYFAVKVDNGKRELLWSRPDFVNWWDSQAVHGRHVIGVRRIPKGRFGSTNAKYAYRAGDGGRAVLECRDAPTGEVVWSAEHPAAGGGEFLGATFSVAGDTVFLHDESRLAMGRIEDGGYRAIASMPLKGPAAPPVPVDGRLYVRTAADGRLRCFDTAEDED